MNTIEARLEKLEAVNRLYKKFFIVLAGLVVSWGLIAATSSPPDVIEAKSFSVIGDKGHETVTVGTRDGHGYIQTMQDTGPAQAAEVVVGYDPQRKKSYITLDGQKPFEAR